MKLRSILITTSFAFMVVLLGGCADYIEALREVKNKEPIIPEFLFVQTAEGGTFKKDRTSELPYFNIRLTGVSDVTSYFSDQPARIAGSMSTADLITSQTFSTSTPNAAIVLMNHNNSNEDVVMGILSEPEYDSLRKTLSYRFFLLEKSPSENLGRWSGKIDTQLPNQFGAVSVFVDDEQGCLSIQSLSCQHGSF